MKYRYSFGAYILAFILQSTLLHNISVLGVSPNLILILTIIFSFLFSGKHGIIFGVMFGLLSDLLFSPIIGAGALSYFLVALLIESSKGLLYRDNLISVVFISVLGTVIYNTIFWGILSIFGGEIGLTYMLLRQPISIMYNAILILPLYWFLVRIVIGYRGFKYM